MNLTTIGHRSGRLHTVALAYFPIDHGWAVVGSAGGSEHEPHWVRNARARDHGAGAVVLRGELIDRHDPIWCTLFGVLLTGSPMAARNRSNPLALAVLICLYERPMHPYEVATTLRQRHKQESVRLNYGSLYNVVASLEKRGLIVPQETVRAGRLPERTVYGLTASGRIETHDWLTGARSRLRSRTIRRLRQPCPFSPPSHQATSSPCCGNGPSTSKSSWPRRARAQREGAHPPSFLG